MSANIDHRAHAVAANGHGAFVFVSVLLLVFLCVVFASITKKLAEDERVNVVKSEFIKLQRASALFKEIYHCEAGSCPRSTLKRIFKDNIPKECSFENSSGVANAKFNKNCALLSLEEIGGVKLQRIKFKNKNLNLGEDYDVLAVKSSFANDAYWFMSPNDSRFKKCKNIYTTDELANLYGYDVYEISDSRKKSGYNCDAVERYLDYLFNVENEAINENGNKIKMPESRAQNEFGLLWFFATIDYENGVIAPILSSDLSHKLDKATDDGLPMSGHVVALEAAGISEEHGGNYADGLKKISSCYDFKREEKSILELLRVDSSSSDNDGGGLSDYLEGIALSVKCDESVKSFQQAKLDRINRAKNKNQNSGDEYVEERGEFEHEDAAENGIDVNGEREADGAATQIGRKEKIVGEIADKIDDKIEMKKEIESADKMKKDCLNYRDFMKRSGQDSVIRPKNEYSDYRDVKYHGCVMVFGA